MKSHSEIVNGDILLRPASSYILSAYTKYPILRELVYETYGNSSIQNATMLNIYIDLNSVLHGLYSEHNRIIIDNITDVSSLVINMCAHYRYFFRSQLGVDTRIFLINSLNTCDINKKFVSGYNATFDRKANITEGAKMIQSNMKLLSILCPYLPAIYYIESSQRFEVSVIIAYLIETLQDENPNLIISHDMYPLQLCSQYRWTSYLYPAKDNHIHTDTSWMVPVNDKPTFRDNFWTSYMKMRKLTSESLKRISPVNYPLLMAIAGIKERDIKPIVQTPAAVKFIESLVGSEDLKISSSMFLNSPELANYPLAMIDARYKAVDVQYALPFYKNSPEAKNIKLLDLDDVATVNNIVAKYYANNPIDLQRL